LKKNIFLLTLLVSVFVGCGYKADPVYMQDEPTGQNK